LHAGVTYVWPFTVSRNPSNASLTLPQFDNFFIAASQRVTFRYRMHSELHYGIPDFFLVKLSSGSQDTEVPHAVPSTLLLTRR
jgi:hypothetical protein